MTPQALTDALRRLEPKKGPTPRLGWGFRLNDVDILSRQIEQVQARISAVVAGIADAKSKGVHIPEDDPHYDALRSLNADKVRLEAERAAHFSPRA